MCRPSARKYRCVEKPQRWNHQSDKAIKRDGLSPVLRLVFSQSLISLDLIEDFLELSCRAKDEDKVSPYKGNSILCFILLSLSFFLTFLSVLIFM